MHNFSINHSCHFLLSDLIGVEKQQARGPGATFNMDHCLRQYRIRLLRLNQKAAKDCHPSSLREHSRPAGVAKMMLTKLVSTREAPEIAVRERILLGIVLIDRG